MSAKTTAAVLTGEERSFQRDPELRARAESVLNFLRHRWFKGRFGPDVELPLATLLLAVYVAAEAGKPFNKKGAMAEIGVEDIRTARKYFSLAEEQGLLTVETDPHDKRKELLYPTQALTELLAEELSGLSFGERQKSNEGVRAADYKHGLAFGYVDRDGYVITGIPFDWTLEAWSKILAAEPTNSEIYRRRARYYECRDLYDLAMRDYTSAIAANPKDADCYAQRAALYKMLGNYENALADYNKAIELRPNSTSLYSDRAKVYERLGQSDKAKSDYANARTLAEKKSSY